MCRHCALRPAIAGTEVCRACVWRFTLIVFRPERFTLNEIDQLAADHHEVVAYAVTTGGVGRWVWTADGWPDRKDSRTLR